MVNPFEVGTAIGLAFSMLCCTAILSIDLKGIRKRLDRIQEEGEESAWKLLRQ